MKQYKESQQILEKIKESKNVLLSLHVSPDADSVGSNFAMVQALKQLAKKVLVISSDQLPGSMTFLPGAKEILVKDISKMNLGNFDLFITLDSAAPEMITESDNFVFPKGFSTVVIDHHVTNSNYGNINLVDDKAGATGEILYNLFIDWNIHITADIAQCLLAAISADTGSFRFANSSDTFHIAGELLDYGASMQELNFNLYGRMSIQTARLWGEILSQIELREASGYKFVWTAVPNEVIKNAGEGADASGLSTVFFSSIEGTDFGLLLVEDKVGEVRGSLRSRTGIDISHLAQLFGGGGHKAASGFKVKIEDSLEKTVNNVLERIEEYLEKQ